MSSSRGLRLLLLAAILVVPFHLLGQDPSQGRGQARGLTSWQPMRVPGSAAMLLVGDPGKHEMFVARFRYPDGMRIGPHWHTTSVHISVLSGTLMLGMGDVFDSTKAAAYGPDSFLVLEGGMHHYEWFRGEVIVHVEGIGPFQTIFLNPADDPRPSS